MPAFRLPDETPLAVLNLSIRAVMTLKDAGVVTLGDLRRMSPRDIVLLPNVGMATYGHIAWLLNEVGR